MKSVGFPFARTTKFLLITSSYRQLSSASSSDRPPALARAPYNTRLENLLGEPSGLSKDVVGSVRKAPGAAGLLDNRRVALVFGHRFLRFLLVGGVNTVFGYSVFAALILLGASYPIAALLATVLGVLFNLKSYGRLVFDSKDNSLIFRYVGVYTISYAVSVGLLALGRQFGLSVLFTAGLFALPLAGFTFWLNRSFVFQRPADVPAQKAPRSLDI